MSLASILQRVQNKGKLPVKSGDENPKEHPQKPSSSRPSPPKPKQVDPVVAQLKEKRRLENELKLQQAREKKGLPPLKRQTAKSSTAKSSTARAPSKPRAHGTKPGAQPTPRQPHKPAGSAHPAGPAQPAGSAPRAASVPAKKLKFTELMKRASKIDQSQLSINIRPKTASPEVSSKPKPGVKPTISKKPGKMAPLKASSEPANRTTPQTKARAPIPIRKPSSVLEQKLKSKSGPTKQSSSRYQYDNDEYGDDEELDGFVVSDEEEQNQYEEADYDRDEIWAMFNKGRKRSYYDRYDDYDSDDMEATGAEILDEEFRSRRTAELEDKREALEEQRLAAAKRARKNRR